MLYLFIYLYIGVCVYVVYQHGDIHFVCGLGIHNIHCYV